MRHQRLNYKKAEDKQIWAPRVHLLRRIGIDITKTAWDDKPTDQTQDGPEQLGLNSVGENADDLNAFSTAFSEYGSSASPFKEASVYEKDFLNESFSGFEEQSVSAFVYVSIWTSTFVNG